MYVNFDGYNFLMWTHELTHTHNLTLHTQVNEMEHISDSLMPYSSSKLHKLWVVLVYAPPNYWNWKL